MPDTNDFTDKIVLVTGAGRGLGRALALAFAARGAIVAANDLTPVNLDETLALIQAAGGRARGYLADIARRMQVQLILDQILEEWGRLDVLVNSAGVAPTAELLEMDDWDWQRTLEVNLTGAFVIMQLAARAMRETGGGAIVHLGGAEVSEMAGRGAFLASKAGLAALARAAGREFLAYNIRVNAVCPVSWGASGAGEGVDRVCGQVLYLCSPVAASVSGQCFQIE